MKNKTTDTKLETYRADNKAKLDRIKQLEYQVRLLEKQLEKYQQARAKDSANFMRLDMMIKDLCAYIIDKPQSAFVPLVESVNE